MKLVCAFVVRMQQPQFSRQETQMLNTADLQQISKQSLLYGLKLKISKS